MSIGLEHVIDVARRMGMTSEIYAVPSLTLGAFEMKPLEVAQIYAGIARMGSVPDLHLINKIEHLNGELLYEALQHESQQVAAEKIAQLISMMKLTLKSGTARAAKKWGFVHTAAGKTGTTSDTKDAWFAGFTPKDLVITWVGYDNNTVSELTGASGALPMWAQYMKKVSAKYEDQDFQWPANLHKKMITYDENKNWLKKPNEDEKLAFELLVE